MVTESGFFWPLVEREEVCLTVGLLEVGCGLLGHGGAVKGKRVLKNWLARRWIKEAESERLAR